MTEETKVQEVIEEIKNANEDTLRETIEKWFTSIRTDSIQVGAKFISAAIFGAIQKHTKKPGKTSLRDYERMTAEIIKIIAVQLTEQNDSVEENANDGTAE